MSARRAIRAKTTALGPLLGADSDPVVSAPDPESDPLTQALTRPYRGRRDCIVGGDLAEAARIAVAIGGYRGE